MKFKSRDFNLNVWHRRFDLTGWKDYYTRVAKAKKEGKAISDMDKFFLKQFRTMMRTPSFEVAVKHKKSGHGETILVDNPKLDRKAIITSVISKIQETRKERKTIKSEAKNVGGLPYQTVGGVFTKPGVIQNMVDDPHWNDPNTSKTPRSKSINYIGVELEFNEENEFDHGIQDIIDNIKAAGLGRYCNVGTDGSCGFEVRVLLPEDRFESILTQVLDVINEMGFSADATCGTHVHIDMRNRDVKAVYNNFFYTQNFMRRFLTRNRKDNEYCKINTFPTFDEQVKYGERRMGINPMAYREHKTLEIRMHQGTLDIKVLAPWIKLLLKIANFKGTLKRKVLTLTQAKAEYNIEEPLQVQLSERLVRTLGRKPKPAIEKVGA